MGKTNKNLSATSNMQFNLYNRPLFIGTLSHYKYNINLSVNSLQYASLWDFVVCTH